MKRKRTCTSLFLLSGIHHPPNRSVGGRRERVRVGREQVFLATSEPLPCPANHYCVDGVAQQCPNSTYSQPAALPSSKKDCEICPDKAHYNETRGKCVCDSGYYLHSKYSKKLDATVYKCYYITGWILMPTTESLLWGFLGWASILQAPLYGWILFHIFHI